MEKIGFVLPRMQTLNFQEKTALNLAHSKKSKTTAFTKKLIQQAKPNDDLDEMLLDSERDSIGSSASREIKQKSVIFALDLVTDQPAKSRKNKQNTSQQYINSFSQSREKKTLEKTSQVKTEQNLIDLASDDIKDDILNETPEIDSQNAKKTLIDQASEQPEVWSQATQAQ